MNTIMNRTFGGRGRRPLPQLATLAALLVLPLAACDLDELVQVDDPELVRPDSLTGPAGLTFLIDGAVGDFQRAYGGGGSSLHSEGIVTTTGALSDELYQADTFLTRNRTDRRDQAPFGQGNTTDITTRLLHQARRSNRDAANGIVEGTEDANDPRIPEVRSLEAYTWVSFGENWCSNVPMSVPGETGIDIVEGDPLTTMELFQGAANRFDQALAINADYHLAAVGKGRALLNMGQYAEAATAVAGVPTEFIYDIEHSDNTGRQHNAVQILQSNGRWSMADEEGGNGLPYRSAGDPRVPWVAAGEGFDRSTPLFVSLRYPERESNVVLADGIEARLIEAEAAVNGAGGGDWLGILNGLRENFVELMSARFDDYEEIFAAGVEDERWSETLEPLEDPGTPAGQVDLIFQERAFWMYLTGHRLGDMRRLLRDYGRSQGDVFPVGDHVRGNTYQNDVAFMMPFDEENNPGYAGGELCDVTQP